MRDTQVYRERDNLRVIYKETLREGEKVRDRDYNTDYDKERYIFLERRRESVCVCVMN